LRDAIECRTKATKPIPQDKHQVRVQFASAGDLATGGNITRYCDGEEVSVCASR